MIVALSACTALATSLSAIYRRHGFRHLSRETAETLGGSILVGTLALLGAALQTATF